MSLSDVLARFGAEVTHFMSTGVVHRDEGTSIASHAADALDDGADPQLAEAYLSEVIKRHLRAQQALDDPTPTEDVILQTTRGLLIARPLGDSDFVWTLMTGPAANPTLTRSLMRRFHDEVRGAASPP